MTVNITPKWEALVPVLLRIYRDTDKCSARDDIEAEILKLARFADQHNDELKESDDGQQE